MKKKVAELQQRKKELQQQRKEESTPPFAKKTTSASAVNDLKGIDLSSIGKWVWSHNLIIKFSLYF